MIIARIAGGLGNQMFQYAIAKSIAKKNSDIFKLDISFYPKQSLRKYELNLFNIEENIATEEECVILRGSEGLWFKIRNKLGLKVKRPDSYYKEKEIAVFDENVFKYDKNIYLDGYWQNENYFTDIRYEILNDFTLKQDISNEAKKHLENIKNINSISLHVRRGDYVQDTHTNKVHGICDFEYYKKAIEHIKNKVEKPMFYIFSDDISWCKENFNFLENKVFIDDTKSALEDLELMKHCKHNIIANSTFSWWGAWLNDNDNKIVIAPKIWWSAKKDKNIACNKWMKI
jgi:hypothetical protein